MLCFDVILFGRIAPAPPAYMLPPQIPSRLNDMPYCDILSMVNGSSEMNRATPIFCAATSILTFSAAFFMRAASAADRGSRPSMNPAISGVLPSSETSDASILMWRQAGLSTLRLFAPWMSDCTGPRPHDLPLVVSSMYTQPSDPPETPALPLGA